MPKPSLLLDKHDDIVDIGADPSSPAAPCAQLMPDDQVRAATDLLVTKNIDTVCVDVFAKRLDMTRSSFYWRFKNHDNLLHQVLQDQSEHMRVDPKLGRQNPSMRGLVHNLLTLSFRGRSAQCTIIIEFAIRAWARHGPMTQEAAEAANEHRMDYYIQHFQTIGSTRRNVKARAFMLYTYQLSETTLWHQDSKPNKDAYRRFSEDTLPTSVPQEDSTTPSRE